MKTFAILLVATGFAAAATPVTARELQADGSVNLPVAYEALRDGNAHLAIDQLTSTTDLAARDPSRLINLGTAYARLGRTSEAAAMYQQAVDSPIRYDLELANGRYVDSRWAARMALDRLTQRPRVTLGMVQLP